MNRLHELGSAVKVLDSRLHWLLHTTCLGTALPPNLHGGLTWPDVPLHARRALEKEGSSDQAWMLRNVLCFLLSTKFEASVDKKIVRTEIGVLLRLSHPNIIKLKEIFETPTEISLVLELVTGGELFDRIVEKGYYSERDAADAVKQILEAVAVSII
ncbi:calcium/calmodulin-dependent protein kinase type IV [Grus japonensis]|uniref:Calcium/calmodulin-dependent protein kinase type IV n=1 Tax=Grus japonensis TaxID=30415 RepID=A0ABC9Y8W4_GRUJA